MPNLGILIHDLGRIGTPLAESNDAEIAAPDSVNRSKWLAALASGEGSNAAAVAIFSHNSAAKNAQKEAKRGKQRKPRSAMQTTLTPTAGGEGGNERNFRDFC